MASLSRLTAARSVADSSVIERDASVAVSMARSARLGWYVGSNVSMFIRRPSWYAAVAIRLGEGAMRSPPLAIRASARLEQRVKDLWLSATGAVLNGGWRPRLRNAVARN